MTIPISKPYLTKDEADYAHETILSHWVTQGPKVEEFEDKFAKYVGSKYAVAVSNCTTALHLAMIVAEIKKDDEVICPSLSFIATANAITYVGAKPVFAEVNPLTYNIDTTHAEKLITNRTKAILIVHQIGLPADIQSFKNICLKHNLKLIEDAACAVGSSYKGKKIGSHSDLVCFSFHPRKVITTGDGGMITTSNKDYYERLRLLRQHGMSINDRIRHLSKEVIIENYVEIGFNYRMTDIQAAVGIKQLEKLNWIVEERRKIAYKYKEALKDIDCIMLPEENEDCYTNFQSYCIYLKETSAINRDELMQNLLNEGIATRRGVMTSHREKPYRNLYPDLSLPISERVSDRSLLLPLYVPISDETINFIVDKIKGSIGSLSKTN